jgi:hypothetical protein
MNNIPAFNRKADDKHLNVPFTEGSPRGLADIIVVHVGRPYFLEVKRKGPTNHQIKKIFRRKPKPREPYTLSCVR